MDREALERKYIDWHLKKGPNISMWRILLKFPFQSFHDQPAVSLNQATQNFKEKTFEDDSNLKL